MLMASILLKKSFCQKLNNIMKKKLRFLIVSSSFYPKITNTMNNEAIKYLYQLDHKYELFQVQGSLEVPVLISILLSKKKYDAVIAIGCIIRGKTSHYDFICGNIVSSLLKLSIKKSIPISNAILNCENMKQATERCSGKKNRAKEAIDAALSVLKNI